MSASLAAQGTGRIIGIVRSDSGRAVQGVDITLRPSEKRTRTDSAGRFELSGVSRGRYVIRARGLGHDPLETGVEVFRDSESTVSLNLRRRNVVLDTVLVVGASCSPIDYQGCICRRRSGHGVFLDFTALDSLDAGNAGTGDAFRTMKGFRVEVTPRGVHVPVAMDGCKGLVQLVNGRPANPANPLPTQLIDVIGMEVYTNATGGPDEYQQYVWSSARRGMPSRRCSVVVYWTH